MYLKPSCKYKKTNLCAGRKFKKEILCHKNLRPQGLQAVCHIRTKITFFFDTAVKNIICNSDYRMDH